MESIFNPLTYDIVVGSMAVLAVVVFIALQGMEAAYGMTYSPKWGPSVSNRAGWVIMELPAFLCMGLIWLLSARREEPALCVMAALFEIHYFQRTFIFPALMRGRNRMPWAIVAMGMVFNTVNAYMIGGWLFHVSAADAYAREWLMTPQFIIGTLIFLAGMAVNIHSDHVIRTLRRPGDSRHYIPRRGMYRFVTGANYFGELTEWIGFAILTWSIPGAVFALWTFANLAPRAAALRRRYVAEFGSRYSEMNLKLIIPFVY